MIAKRKVLEMGQFFTMQGRMNRLKYFAFVVVLTVASYVCAFWLGIMVGFTGGTEAAAEVLGFVLGVAFQIVIALQVVKRLHDLNRPGWHYWLLLIPFYNLYLGIILCFEKGTEGPNRYGTDPVAASTVAGPHATGAVG